MTLWSETWYDEESGPLVRRYARIGDRTTAVSDDLELNALVTRIPDEVVPAGLTSTESSILRLSSRPVSLSEIAANLDLPIGEMRALLAGLTDAGLITVRRPSANGDSSPDVLQQLLAGLRSL
jgi:DNA-binding transcriptional ArsR family regulator